MADYADCPNYLSEFLFYMLTIQGRSKRTVDAYYIDLRTFMRYIKCVKLLRENPNDRELFDTVSIRDIGIDVIGSITLSDVYQFLNYAASDRENNAKTRSRKVSSIRSLFSYLTIKSNLLKANPVENLELPSIKKSMPRYLTLEESLELLLHIPQSSSYERDFCIVTLLLNCGMRLSELVGINTFDIRENTIKLLGKGNKERIIYINDACLQAIAAYLPVRKSPTVREHRDALFLSARGTRISPRRVEQIVETCLQQAGLSGQGYSPHKLRHTAATLMYQHGNVDIRVLKEILGHVSLSTTEIYTHVSSSQMENAAKQSPLSSVSPKKRKSIPAKLSESDNE